MRGGLCLSRSAVPPPASCASYLFAEPLPRPPPPPPAAPLQEVDVQKYWWSLRILQTGLRVLYLDPDSVVLTHDLMAPFYKPYDVQGLSDWAESELHLTGQGLGTHCDLGPQAAERRGAGADIKGLDPDAAAALEKRVQAMSPCQSTSLFYLQPTDITVRFVQDLVAELVFGAAAKWERVAWNERIVAYLYGMGNDVQLTYRILPVNEFCSMGARRRGVAAGARPPPCRCAQVGAQAEAALTAAPHCPLRCRHLQGPGGEQVAL